MQIGGRIGCNFQFGSRHNFKTAQTEGVVRLIYFVYIL
ncbi:hypothetical protein C4K04_2647 [Pseudomonas chlororaphis]|uniref:Uncharacterized protein n=1 Tax=Pseudomonas chlororaphis TaxID=587753 RepID=A0A3G7TPY1_9PSED|nr:hypothetical protein C4K04_2647 [Pseudomonas chlororaphis]